MNIITINADTSVSVVVRRNGAPVPLSGSITADLTTTAGAALVPGITVSSTTPGSDWANGQAVVTLSAAQTAALPAGDALLVLTGPFGTKAFAVACRAVGAVTRSALFVRDVAVDQLRDDSLMMAARGAMPGIAVTDDYLWAKLLAAEYEMSHELRVPLVPTAFFAQEPSQDEVAALNGMPWGIDPGYDYHPNDFSFNDKWGFVRLRNKPLHTVSRVRFAYPGGTTAHYDLPLDWVRADKKYGHIQFVPSSTAFAAPLNTFVMQAIGNGRTIPLALQINYVAGLADVRANYPELMDAIFKMASLKVIEDAYLPQSGSISADGLSQSISNDMEKHSATVDRIINGGKGGNGGLMAAIHGIRVGVM